MEIKARQRTGSRVFGVVFKIGDLIANRYRVSDIIGSGGAGVVYRAHDQEIDVDVAVKVINAKLVQTADEQRLFSRQTKIARKLSHQNVVRIYDEGRDEERPFYTMQFLEGLSLRKIIDLRKEKHQTFQLAEIEPIYNQLCQALDYSHKTTFHGDLKPDNVIVLPDLLKVTDFALLRGLPRKPFLAIQKSRSLNFRYLAPEVRLEVNELDRLVDLYSLGVVLLEMLSGHVYDDAKPEQLSSAPGVDAAVVPVLKRALARAPKDRYPSALDLYEDLRSVVAKGLSRGVRVPPTSGEPPQLAEMPTQRLDLQRHGSRPVPEQDGPPALVRSEGQLISPEMEALVGSPPALPPYPPLGEAQVNLLQPERPPESPLDAPTKDSRPKPVEVQATLAVPDSPAIAVQPDGSGTFATIDDDMIESASPSSAQESARPALSPLAEPPGMQMAPELSPQSAEVEAQHPPASFEPGEEETEAYDNAPVPAAPAPADHGVEAVLEGLVEISNSAIELIADPRATNLIRLEAEAQRELAAHADRIGSPKNGDPLGEGDEALISEPNRTLEPKPLPDSALPSPAFSQAVARDPTAHGRLDGGSSEVIPLPGNAPPVAPQVVVRGAGTIAGDLALPAKAEGGVVAEPASQRPRTMPAPTNGSSKHKNGRSTKPRPMTRPRMSAIPSIAEPVVIGGSAPLSTGALFEQDMVRQTTGSRPLVVVEPVRANQATPLVGANLVSQLGLQAPRTPPPQPQNRALIWTVGLSVAALIAVVLTVFKLQANSQAQQTAQLAALQSQILQMQSIAKEANSREQAALDDAKNAGAQAEDAAKAQLAASRAADEAKAARAKAESEAKQREADAKRLEEEARASRDAKKKEEAEKAAAVAQTAAMKRRQEADVEAKRERDERVKEEREKKRKEKEELARTAAEKRAERERDAKQRAEEKATKLKADREAAAEASRQRKEERAAAAEEKKREAAEKKAAEEAKRAEAADSKKSRAPIIAASVDTKAPDVEEKPKADEKPKAKEAAAESSAEEAPAPSTAAAATAGGKACPKGMVLIDSGQFMLGAPRNDPERNFGDITYQAVDVGAYCIDYYEFPNGRGHVPATAVNFKSAQAQCKKKGKRLCTENEWEKACKGPSGSRFPYGNQWDPAACATEDDEGNKREVAKSGDFKRCRSGYNVFDMSGNASEWTATEYGQGGFVVKGGSADRPGYDGRCAARKKKKAVDADALLGFRCCSDPG
jgi:serine/threonine protein kinase